LGIGKNAVRAEEEGLLRGKGRVVQKGAWRRSLPAEAREREDRRGQRIPRTKSIETCPLQTDGG
jgi:hypothetical protein